VWGGRIVLSSSMRAGGEFYYVALPLEEVFSPPLERGGQKTRCGARAAYNSPPYKGPPGKFFGGPKFRGRLFLPPKTPFCLAPPLVAQYRAPSSRPFVKKTPPPCKYLEKVFKTLGEPPKTGARENVPPTPREKV